MLYLGLLGGALFLVGVSFLNCTQTALAVTLMTLSTTMSGVSLCGFFVNNMDIAPQYAGTLMGISNGIAAASGFIAPLIASVLTTDVSPTQFQRNVLCSNGAIFCCTKFSSNIGQNNA